jgi:hypothetical protein
VAYATPPMENPAAVAFVGKRESSRSRDQRVRKGAELA